MIAADLPLSEVDEDGRALLPWIVPVSFALHVAVFAWLPSARHVTTFAPPPLVVEVDVPPPPPPPPKEEALARAPVATSLVHAAAPRTASRAEAPVAAEAPLDFTNTVLSNDGPGLAVLGGGGSATSAPASIAPARSASPPPRAPPRVVPLASLSRRPRAPGLDVELERQYPIEARHSGISGHAVLRVRILADGRIGPVTIASATWPGFGPACERTVRAARWEPPIDRDGTPVATEITYTCRFEIRS